MSSPVVGADGTVYVASYDNNLYALDGATGLRKWSFPTGSIGNGAAAIGADGTVYAGAGRAVVALDGATGQEKWSFQTGSGVDSSPAIGSDGTVYVGSDDNVVYALDGQTGTPTWTFRTKRTGAKIMGAIDPWDTIHGAALLCVREFLSVKDAGDSSRVAVILQLGERTLVVESINETSELKVGFRDIMTSTATHLVREASSDPPFAALIGSPVREYWFGENSRGYDDLFIIAFGQSTGIAFVSMNDTVSVLTLSGGQFA